MKLSGLLSVILAMLGTFNANAQKTDTKTISYWGNTITIFVQMDTNFVVDPETAEELMHVTRKEKIAELNGNPIYFYYDHDAIEPVGAASQNNLQQFLTDRIGNELSRIERFHFIDVVIDETGKLAYLNIHVRSETIDGDNGTGPAREKIRNILNDVKFIPAQKDGKAVPYAVRISS